MNKWNEHLTASNRIITVASVYAYSGGKTTYYSYAYKVDGQFYFESTSGRNISRQKLDSGSIENFIVVVSGSDPTIHCILWNQKMKDDIKLGTIFNRNITRETIKDYTVGIGLSPRGEIDSEKQIKYLNDYSNN